MERSEARIGPQGLTYLPTYSLTYLLTYLGERKGRVERSEARVEELKAAVKADEEAEMEVSLSPSLPLSLTHSSLVIASLSLVASLSAGGTRPSLYDLSLSLSLYPSL